jgi:hypothetical protein
VDDRLLPVAVSVAFLAGTVAADRQNSLYRSVLLAVSYLVYRTMRKTMIRARAMASGRTLDLTVACAYVAFDQTIVLIRRSSGRPASCVFGGSMRASPVRVEAPYDHG